MKAITLDALGTPPKLHDDLDPPAPAPGQVLVRVRASSVNPVDNAIAAGMLDGMFEHEFPVVLGRDYAGVVEEIGEGVTRYDAGDEVYGFVLHADPLVQAGAWAELITVGEGGGIALVPAGLTLEDAGAAALAGVTAMTAVGALRLAEGDTVLVAGAAGGVGSLAVQLVADAGATVIAPALPEDEELLRGLGVAEVVPRDGDVAAAVRELRPDGVDALLDLVSYGPGEYDGALKDGARVASPNDAAGEGEGLSNVMASPTTENLERLAALLADGSLRVPIHRTYELAQAPEALAALGAEHTQGKLALRVG